MAADFWIRERDRLYEVFQASSDGIALFDLEGRLLLANPAFQDFFGSVPGELSGQDPARTLGFLTSRAKDAADFEGRFRRLLLHPETTERDTVELALPYPRALSRSRAPVRDNTGKVRGQVHTLRDVTREREVARMKSEFISRASHELRTPLTSIKGSLQLLIETAQNLPPLERELLSVCLRNADRLIHLVNDILDLSRIEAGKLKLKLADQMMPHLVELALAGVKGMAEERQTTIDVAVPPDLPAVRADRDRIVQVLVNLLSNAIKFSHPGGSITVSARQVSHSLVAGDGPGVEGGHLRAVSQDHPADCLEVRVADRGRGIAPDDLDRLFLSFQQLESSATRETPGAGLGLAICKGIIEAHGGRIWVGSEGLGRGAALTFMLPLSGPPRRRILVADDEPKFAALLMETLRTAGYSVTSAPDGKATLEMIQQDMPDLLVLDLLLPEVDGWEVLKILRAGHSTRDLPILVVTAVKAAGAERPLALGADEYLSKPISSSVLLDTVGRLIAAADLRRREAVEGRVGGS